jgi:hypothetical protein
MGDPADGSDSNAFLFWWLADAARYPPQEAYERYRRLLLETLATFIIFLVAAAVLQLKPRTSTSADHPCQQEPETLTNPLAVLKLDLQGFVHVADDGIARSY